MKTSTEKSGLSEEDRASLKLIAQNIVDGDCVLFLGAGVNMCSEENHDEYPPELRPPTGTELTKILIDDLEQARRATPNAKEDDFDLQDPNNLNLSRVAQYHEVRNNDRLPLARILRRHILHGKEPSPRLCELATLPFEYIITTNYDVLYEKAFALTHNKNVPHVRVYRPSRSADRETLKPVAEADISPEKPFLYKIHGDINDSESLVITDENYIHFIQRMRDTGEISPIPDVFSAALARKSILFIGYRLMDYNLRLLLKTIRWGRDPSTMPRNYSIDPKPDHLILKISDSNYLTKFIVSDLWTVIPDLKKMVEELKHATVTR